MEWNIAFLCVHLPAEFPASPIGIHYQSGSFLIILTELAHLKSAIYALHGYFMGFVNVCRKVL